jgi:hypothetical protein
MKRAESIIEGRPTKNFCGCGMDGVEVQQGMLNADGWFSRNILRNPLTNPVGGAISKFQKPKVDSSVIDPTVPDTSKSTEATMNASNPNKKIKTIAFIGGGIVLAVVAIIVIRKITK